MFKHKQKGYRIERKIRMFLEERKWIVVRAGGSLGEADLIGIKDGTCKLFQVKSTKKDTFYYYGYMKEKLAGIQFHVIVDFGRGNIRVLRPQGKIKANDGESLENFLERS